MVVLALSPDDVCGMKMKARRFAFGILTLAALAGAHAQTLVPSVRPEAPALDVRSPFEFDKKKVRRSASGIACLPQAAGHRCLVVFDEGAKAQFALVGAERLEPIGALVDLAGANDELDAEGAAQADGFYYVIGSHSVKRESCKVNPAGRTVIRFKASAPAGSPPRIEVSDLTSTTRLWDLMREDPYLGRHTEGCLGNGDGPAAQMQRSPGVNIEGIAISGGRLYAGFRAPSEDGLASVFSVDAKALFGPVGSNAAPRLDRLRLGPHVGIRDMAAAHDSILLLIGPDDFDAGASAVWQVSEWKLGAATQPRVLATLDVRKQDIGDACFEALKPEALAILDQSPSRFRILVLSDGVCDGGPLVFEIPR